MMIERLFPGRFSKQLRALTFCAAALAAGFALGFVVSGLASPQDPRRYEATSHDEPAPVIRSGIAADLPAADGELAFAETNRTTGVETSERAIREDAKIIYETCYAGDGVTVSEETRAPAFLAGAEEGDLRQLLRNWELVGFEPAEITVRRTLDEKSGQNYILGVYNGFVAVYIDEGAESGKSALKEVTGRPVSALDANDVSKLEGGVRVTGDEELYKLLQDYGS